jgi:zinc protease
MSDEAVTFTPVPKPRWATLPGGAPLIVCESRAAPHVTFQVVTPSGSAHDSIEQAGLSSLTSGLMRSGAGDLDEPAMSEALDRMAAGLSASAARTHWEVAGDITTLREGHLERLLDLATDMASKPRFEESEVDKSRMRRLARLRQLGDDQGSLCARAFEMTTFAGHPYGIPAAGTLTSIANLDAAAVRTRHAEAWAGKRGRFAMAGDISIDEAVALLSERFGDWGAPDESDSSPDVRPAAGLRATLVNKDDPNLSQVHFRIGGALGVRLTSADYFAFRLAAQVLGGDFTARLNQRLRVQEGLTYGARWNFAVGSRRAGIGGVATYAPAKDAARAIKLALGELTRFVDDGPDEAEVADFKRKLINGFPFRFETASQTAGQHLWQAREGLPQDWMDGYQRSIDALTVEEVHAAAKAHLPVANAHIVAVGNLDLAESLAELVGGQDRVDVRHIAEYGVADAPAGDKDTPATPRSER